MVSVRAKTVENIFRPPRRSKVGLVYFGGAAVFLSMYLFMDDSLFTLSMFSGFLLTGAAEFLPEERNVLAGVLRIMAITVYIVVLALTFLRPEAII
ncbi:hypothetical protein [Candidatus Nanohalococcus occultus]|uniref:hypothetical protein n=1 Tax=Candidatus Nanohalococcus occultus TaxID=2978047 RepID=UPI0039E03E83